MNKMHWALALVLVCAIGELASAQPLTDRLPASTTIYLGWSPSASLQSTAAAKMIADERVMAPWRRLFQDMLLHLRDKEEGPERISEHLPQLLSDAAQCEGCFAVLEVRAGQHRWAPQSVLMIDLGARRKSFEEHFKPVHSRMKQRLGDRLQMMKLEKSWVYFEPDRDGKPRLTWGFVGDTFVVFVGETAEQFIPRLVRGKIDAPLKTAPAFVDCISKLPGESVFTTYLDVKAALALGRRLMEREANSDLRMLLGNWDKLLDELGVGNVKGLIEKTVVEDKQFVTRTLVRLDGAPKGLLGLVAQPSVDDAMMKVIPADSMVAAAFRLDLAKIYEQVKGSMINIAGKDAQEGFNQIEQGAEGMGLPVKDVLAPLGDQWAIYNAPSQGGFVLTGWTLVADLRDPQKMGRTIGVIRNLLLKGSGQSQALKQFQVEGVRIEYVSPRGFDMPFSPAWAIVENKLILALYPQHVEDAVRHIKQGGKSILDNPEYAAGRRRTGGQGAVVWCNGPEVVRNVYPLALVLVNFAAAFSGRHDAEEESFPISELLPSVQRLLDYTGCDTFSQTATADGLLGTRSVANPLLSPLVWINSDAAWVAIALMGLDAADDQADRIKSAANLRQIGQAMMLYAADNNGAFPPDLQTLQKKDLLTPDVTRSPMGPAKEGSDIVYVYFAGMKTAGVDAQTIIAYDQAALEQGEGTNVLYGDGHVDWVEAGAFKGALDASRKRAQLKNAAP